MVNNYFVALIEFGGTDNVLIVFICKSGRPDLREPINSLAL